MFKNTVDRLGLPNEAENDDKLYEELHEEPMQSETVTSEELHYEGIYYEETSKGGTNGALTAMARIALAKYARFDLFREDGDGDFPRGQNILIFSLRIIN